MRMVPVSMFTKTPICSPRRSISPRPRRGSLREPAVRDFYDFDYAVQTGSLQPEAADFVALVRQKLAMPGNEGIDVSDTRREQLVRQLEAELRPVLRPADFEAFDFDRAFARVVEFAGRVS